KNVINLRRFQIRFDERRVDAGVDIAQDILNCFQQVPRTYPGVDVDSPLMKGYDSGFPARELKLAGFDGLKKAVSQVFLDETFEFLKLLGNVRIGNHLIKQFAMAGILQKRDPFPAADFIMNPSRHIERLTHVRILTCCSKMLDDTMAHDA